MTEYNAPKDYYDLVILPIGSGFKTHGEHLPMHTDQLMAEVIAKEVKDVLFFKETLTLPTVTYGYYPAFKNKIDLEAFQFIHTLARIIREAKKYCNQDGLVYIINTGISTEKLITQSFSFDKNRIQIFHISKLNKELKQPYVYPPVEQEEGSHADEIETSLMLHLYPNVVKYPIPKGFIDNDEIFGQPELATQEKGKFWFSYMMNLIYNDIMSENEA